MTDRRSVPPDPPGDAGTSSPTTDPYATEAGAYVLGALSGPERQAFEVHLAGCPSCRADVADVAALPSLLDRVPRELVESLGPTGGVLVPEGEPAASVPVVDPTVACTLLAAGSGAALSPAGWWGTGRVDAPAGMLVALLREVRREERSARRRRGLVGALATAAVVVGTLVVSGTPLPWRGAPAVSASSESASSEPTSSEQAFELTALGGVPITATVVLGDVAWGTVIDLSCRYDAPVAGPGGGRYDDSPSGDALPPDDALPTYSLVVRDASGATEEVATWSAVPGKDLTVPASTAMLREDIVLVEMRAEDGTALMRVRT